MAYGKSQGWLWAAVCVALVSLGCPRAENPDEKPGKPAGTSVTSKKKSREPGREEPAPTAKPPKKVEPPPPPTIPKVTMADTDLAKCRVRVGDAMPDAELPDLSGKKLALRSLYGKKLTVVVFWTGTSIYALQELQDLQTDVAKPYADKGVRVVGVHEGEDAKAARESLETAEATFPSLLDPGGAYFAKVGTERLPRTYLLDATGKILWFDIEYSRSTRRDLQQGIKVALGELK